MIPVIYMVAALAFLGSATPAVARDSSAPAAKLSRNNICHSLGSPGYAQTQKFTAYPSLEACLEHGRLPKENAVAQDTLGAKREPAGTAPRYDRDSFGGWVDADGDCLNTRHALLRDLSTGPLRLKGRCRVETGRWLDPYTGKIFTRAADVDIDHIVPLAYAWARGAAHWPAQKRVDFANDPVNLLVVDRATNRDKGAKGPLDWLPPEPGYHCQYILRFQRLSKSYQLEPSAGEARALVELQRRLCKGQPQS